MGDYLEPRVIGATWGHGNWQEIRLNHRLKAEEVTWSCGSYLGQLKPTGDLESWEPCFIGPFQELGNMDASWVFWSHLGLQKMADIVMSLGPVFMVSSGNLVSRMLPGAAEANRLQGETGTWIFKKLFGSLVPLILPVTIGVRMIHGPICGIIQGTTYNHRSQSSVRQYFSGFYGNVRLSLHSLTIGRASISTLGCLSWGMGVGIVWISFLLHSEHLFLFIYFTQVL